MYVFGVYLTLRVLTKDLYWLEFALTASYIKHPEPTGE